MKKAVVLGAAGAMGREIVKELLARGVETVAFGRSREKLERMANTYGTDEKAAPLSIVAGDAFRPDDIAAAAKGRM